MKVKIQSGKLVVEEDHSENFFHITSPNGHTLRLPICRGFPRTNLESTTPMTQGRLVRWTQLTVDELKSIKEHSQLTPYIFIGYGNNNTNHMVYDIVKETWIIQPLIVGTISSKSEMICYVIEEIEQSLINRILAYDRECESVKYLRIIGTFCEHLLTRPQLLDYFSTVATTINTQTPNANVNDEKETNVKQK